MVSHRLGAAARACGSLAATAALIAAAACRRETGAGAPAVSGSAETRIAEAVRARYTAGDVEAAGAWAWTGPDSITYVLIDAQSRMPGIVQARAELWMANERDAALFGRSETLPSAAEIGAYAFEDLTGDGVPDLFGYVADSSGVSFPVFFPGSRPGMTEEIALAASGWRFSTDEEHEPRTYRTAGGRACALQLWAEEDAPDRQGAGWRWLPILPEGRLGSPLPVPPECGTPDSAGVQPNPATP